MILKKNNKEIRSNESSVVKKYSPLIKEFRYQEDIRVLAYYPLFFIRRIIFSVTAYCLLRYPFAQIAVSCFFTLLTIVYIKKYKPYKESYINLVMISQEIVTFIVFSLLSLFLFPSLETYNNVWTYLIIALSGSLFAISLLFSIVTSVKKIIHKLKKSKPISQKIQVINENEQPINVANQNKKKPSHLKSSENLFSELRQPNNSAIVSPVSSFTFDNPSKSNNLNFFS